ncbi:hypothetical protein OPV22_004387 [Ensete ventricosum]|uniref:F-box domain-containing protein n=1 Tax=Ensete ventricosum TaxID=4639 RepID=A0AAV8S3M3_ENSVE|nr:hypothetical protein OPV22_004387 [Ensete ventricosum]
MELCALETPQILSPLNDFHQLLICGPKSVTSAFSVTCIARAWRSSVNATAGRYDDDDVHFLPAYGLPHHAACTRTGR